MKKIMFALCLVCLFQACVPSPKLKTVTATNNDNFMYIPPTFEYVERNRIIDSATNQNIRLKTDSLFRSNIESLHVSRKIMTYTKQLNNDILDIIVGLKNKKLPEKMPEAIKNIQLPTSTKYLMLILIHREPSLDANDDELVYNNTYYVSFLDAQSKNVVFFDKYIRDNYSYYDALKTAIEKFRTKKYHKATL